MNKKSKFVYLLVALIFIFTSLAGGAFAVVNMSAHESGQIETGFHVNSLGGSPSYSIAGDCDMTMGCGSGSG